MRPLVGALVAMCALVVLACGGSDGGADDHGAARERTSTAPTSAAVIASTTTARPAATGGPDDGCPSNGGREPGGVVKASVVDVDGDGRHDEVWYSSGPQRVGISTASGRVVARNVNSAKPVNGVAQACRRPWAPSTRLSPGPSADGA